MTESSNEPIRKKRSRRRRRSNKPGLSASEPLNQSTTSPPRESSENGLESESPKAISPTLVLPSSSEHPSVSGDPVEPPGKGAVAETGVSRSSRRRRRRRSQKKEGVVPTAPAEVHELQVKAGPTPDPVQRSITAAPKQGERRGRHRPIHKADVSQVVAAAAAGGRVMLINVTEGEECRIAIMHQNRLEELFIERASNGSHVGNIYKGRITNVEPSIQAAFIDFGLPKNGFLHISDLQPQYFPDHRGRGEDVGRKTPRRERPPIQRCLRRGQEVLVQVIKEGIGTKGPTLTTYISIPGRYLVMMPGMNRLGVSRKIEDEEARRKMRKILDEMEFQQGMGIILRTAGLDQTKRELQKDYLYLQRLWKIVADRIKHEAAPCELYRESDLVIRTIRDVYSTDFSKIVVDDQATATKVADFLSIAMPRSSVGIEVYTERKPLFHKFNIEAEIERLYSRQVPLRSGGSLVIDSTEAMVTIDVNSGRFREYDDAEETAYRINLEAAEEIARQLRLRDLGGLILCDFVDMHAEKHRREVERSLREALKKHKERAKCLRMSQFGIIEMTRQRMRPSIKHSIYQNCPHCKGAGLVKNTESMTLDIMRLLRVALHREQVAMVEIRIAPEVAFQLQNRKRAALAALEQQTGRRIVIRADRNLGPDQYEFKCFDQRGGAVQVAEIPEEKEPQSDRRGARPSASGAEDRFDDGETVDTVFD